MNRVFVATLVLSLCLMPTHSVAQNPPSTGARIGAIVTDALNAALPGVGALLKLFRPDKVNDKQVNAEVTKARRALLGDAAAKLKELTGVVSELEASYQFVEASAPAANRCSRFLGVLDTNDTAAAPKAWSECQEKLKAITAVSKAILAAVADDAIRLRLIDVQGLVADAQPEIDGAVKAANWPDVKAQMRALTQSLNAVLAIAGVEVSRFKSATEIMVQWANQPAGAVPPPPPLVDKLLLTEADTAVADARKVIPRRPR